MPPKKELLFPIFLECCQYTDDVFWNEIFEDLAYGKCPFGTYFSKGFFCSSVKGKEFLYKIERKDSKIVYEEIYKILKEKLLILSPAEKLRNKNNFYNETLHENKEKTWASIRKKNEKDSLYENYVLDLKRKHNLSVQQSKYLLSLILIGIFFKTITSKDIVFENAKIVNINGIEIKDGKIIVNKNIFVDDNNESCLESMMERDEENEDENEENEIHYVNDNWNSYVKHASLQQKYVE